jgi:muconolactone D-isomerase
VEFLVHIAVRLPPDMAAARREELLAAERVRGRELMERGTIARIWRIPGTLANYGIWQGADADEVHAAIAGLPLFAYFATVEVTALATHPLEADD